MKRQTVSADFIRKPKYMHKICVCFTKDQQLFHMFSNYLLVETMSTKDVLGKCERAASKVHDLHSELLMKCSTPNRGLVSVHKRIIPEPKPEPIPQWKQIYQEFQAKRLSKNIQS